MSMAINDDGCLFKQPAYVSAPQYRRRTLSAPPVCIPMPVNSADASISPLGRRGRDGGIASENLDLAPNLRTMSIEDTLSPSPSSVPFVLEEGRFSFCTPSTFSSSTSSTFSTIPSSSGSSRLFSVSSGSSHSSTYAMPCALEEISIWRIVNGIKQVCAESLGGSVSDVVSLHSLDRSSSRYGAIHTVVSRAGCPSVRLQIPITPAQAEGNVEDVDSIISILAASGSSVRLMAETYKAGTLSSSCELPLKQDEPKYAEGPILSAKLPQYFLHAFKDEAGIDNTMDDILLLRFTQQHSEPESNKLYDTLLVLCELQPEVDRTQTGIKVSLLQPSFPSHQAQSLPEDPLATVQFSDDEYGLNGSPFHSSRKRNIPRPIPRLSVAIPPAAKNGIQIYSDSPASGFPRSSTTGPVLSVARINPLPEIPQTALPMTPQDQLIKTPNSPPELHRGSTTRSIFLPTPSEGYYPFTLSTGSPGDAPSPAFGVLDPGSMSPARRTAPAWSSFGSPFTPSFFQRLPQTAANHVPQINLPEGSSGTSYFPQSPREDNENTLLSPHSIYPDSPSVYSAASYRSFF